MFDLILTHCDFSLNKTIQWAVLNEIGHVPASAAKNCTGKMGKSGVTHVFFTLYYTSVVFMVISMFGMV